MKNKLKNTAFLLKYSWQKCRLLFLTSSAKHLFSVFLPLIDIAGLGFIVGALTDRAPKDRVIRLILIYAAVNFAFSTVGALLTLADNIVMRKASDITQLDYMSDCVFINYHYVQDGSMLDLKRKSIGAQPAWFIENFCGLIFYALQYIIMFCVFAFISPWYIPPLVAFSLVIMLLNSYKQKLGFEFQNAKAGDDRKLEYLYRVMSDYKYAKDIRICRADAFVSAKYDKILKKQIKELNAFSNKNLNADLVIAVATVLQSVAVYAYFAWRAAASHITVAEYTVLLGTAVLFAARCGGFFKLLGELNQTVKYAELFREYRDKVDKNSDISRGTNGSAEKIDWENAEVVFENVSFTYPGADRLILDNINFTVKPGEKIGIVGLNGCGKTTLVKLLLRLYDPSAGRITLNGVDIRTVPHGEYVKKIGTVLQDFFLFAYSVRENIVFDANVDGDNDENRLVDAVKKCGLSAKLCRLKKGLETAVYKELYDDGVEFSGGEGQKLALARAVYKRPGVFILDEPTSALDPVAEYGLFTRLVEISGGRTTFYITHRLSSVRFCDKILVISNGRIAESGTHDELTKQNGFYAKLFTTQAKFYAVEGGVK